MTTLGEAERRAGLTRDPVMADLLAPSSPEPTVAQRDLGTTLYELLDGPDRALTRRLDDARRNGDPLHLVVRLRSTDRQTLAQHPALSWHPQLLTSPEGPLALAPDVSIAVQFGDTETTAPEIVTGGRLRVLFMAYSPRDVRPVLDYEAEEERILVELAPFVEERRLVLKVAEDGSLDELKRRLMQHAYDVVHLTGHGVVTSQGPRLVMEDATGGRDDVSAEQLLKALRAGRAMPRLLVISSCHSADQRTDLPSLAAELIQGGVPCVVGWTRPVLDDVATDAAEELYRRLCSGDLPTEAVACARRALDRGDQSRPIPTHAWATLQLLATKVPGFALNPDESPARDVGPPTGAVYKFLGSRMRVLGEGFVGRRREIQALGRILRHGRWAPPGEAERAVAGALVVGMKGQGKSCLVGRALERHQQDTGELSLVVLHGALDELQLLEAFRTEAVRMGDAAAEQLLADPIRPPPQRIEWLLRHYWRERRLVIVLDDFEQNLDIPGVGEARLAPVAAELLEVLLPVCRDEQPKLLVTSTARFALPAHLASALVDLPVNALDGASVRKLWLRGRGAELAGLGPDAWRTLSERFGRNARLLDWARQLLAGKTPDEVRKVMAEAGTQLPTWKDQPVDEERADGLVAAFLRHMAFDEAKRKVGPDAMTFIERARVYEVPVPVDAFTGLTVDLAVSLDQHVPALANLGLLEIGTEGARAVYRVSPLVKPAFDATDGERWHEIAAEYWWKTAVQEDRWSTLGVLQAWTHALEAKRQAIADKAADLLSPELDECGAYAYSAALGSRHVAVFPNSVAGLNWAGYALFRAGDPREGRRLLEHAVALASSSPAEVERQGWVTDSFARVLASLGEYTEATRYFAELVALEENRHPDGSARLGSHLHELAGVLLDQGDLVGARTHLERSLVIKQKVYGTEDHPAVAASLHELARVLHARGDLAGARARLERSLEIKQKVHGTEDHPAVAASLHVRAGVLRDQGDLAGARTCLERLLEIEQKVHGTEDHRDVAAFLFTLASVLQAQGNLAGARACLERSLIIQQKVHSTEDHPAIAASLHELARVLRAQGDLAGARVCLERSLVIQQKFHGGEDHPTIATSLHELARILRAQGDLAGARARLEQSLEIQRRVHGTEEHPDVAASLHELAGVFHAQGDLAGARARLERSLDIKQNIHSTENHPDVAASLHELAGVLHAQGDLAGARSRLERSLDIKQKVHGTQDHPDVAASLHALGSVLHAQGDLAGARASLERSLDIQENVHGTQDHPDIAASLHELAGVLRAQGNLAGARTHLERSLDIQQKVHGSENHPSVAASLHELARVLRGQGDLPGARTHLERSLEIQQKVHGTLDHPNVAASFHELAGVLRDQGDLARARARLEQSLDIWQKIHGTEDHPSVAISFHALAIVLRVQGDLVGARAYLERSLRVQQKVHGTEDHPDVAASLHELASVLYAQGDMASARARLERSLEIKQKVHGTQDHPDVAASLHELAGVLHAQGDLAGAHAFLERSLDIWQKVHGTEEHPLVAASLHALGVMLHTQGDLAGARSRLERSLEIKQKVHGTEDHPDVAASLHTLAIILRTQGDLAGARSRLERSLDIQQKVYGTEDHPDVAASLNALANVLHAQGDLAGARSRLERSLEVLQKVHGIQDHPAVAANYDGLGNCLRDLEHFDESERAFRTALRIREKVFGTRDHYLYAETELTLVKLLLQRERPDEARDLFRHAVDVLRGSVPNHPILAALANTSGH